MGKIKWNKSAVERAAIISGGCALLVGVISLVPSFFGRAEMNIAVDTNVQIATPGPISDKLDACENPHFLTDTLTTFVPYVPPDTTSTSVLEVVESVAQPEDMKVPQASGDIPISAIDLAVRGDENISLEYIEVGISGMGALNAIHKVKIFDGLYEKGSNGVQEDGVVSIDLRNDPVTVETGKTKTIVFAADFRNGCVGHSFRVGLDGSNKLWAVGKQTGGNVEIKLEAFEGPAIEIAAPETSSITLIKTRLIEDRVSPGDENVVLGRYHVVNSGFQRAMIQAFLVENKEKENNVSNIRLVIGGDVFVGEESSGGKIIFDLCTGAEGSDDRDEKCKIVVGQNEQIEFVFLGDIVSGDRGDKITLVIGDGIDFIMVGMQSGFGGKVLFQDESGKLSDNWTEAMEQTIYLK